VFKSLSRTRAYVHALGGCVRLLERLLQTGNRYSAVHTVLTAPFLTLGMTMVAGASANHSASPNTAGVLIGRARSGEVVYLL
jgi:hypothetical protein